MDVGHGTSLPSLPLSAVFADAFELAIARDRPDLIVELVDALGEIFKPSLERSTP